MGKTFRFLWSHSKGGLVAPPDFNKLDSREPVKSLIISISQQISNESGAKQLPGLLMVALHYCMLAALLVVYCLVESNRRYFLTGLILLAAPFLSFVPIVYAMIRDSPIVKINNYMDEKEAGFIERLSEHRYSMTSLFISDAMINGKPYSFFERSVLGRNFSGFIEFEEKKTGKISKEIEENTLPVSKQRNFIDIGTASKNQKESLEKNVVVPKQTKLQVNVENASPLLKENENGSSPITRNNLLSNTVEANKI